MPFDHETLQKDVGQHDVVPHYSQLSGTITDNVNLMCMIKGTSIMSTQCHLLFLLLVLAKILLNGEKLGHSRLLGMLEFIQ